MEFQTPEREPDIEIVTVKKEPSTALKVGVLIVLIALLIVGILLPIKLVPTAFSTFGTNISSFFNGNKSVTLSTDKEEIDNDVPFTLSWSGPHETDGTYILSYDCVSGVHFETSINQPYETIGCNAQYYFSPQENSIGITPFSTSTQSVEVPMSLSFLKNGDANPVKKADIVLTIVNQTVAQETASAATTTSSYVSTPTPTKTTHTPASSVTSVHHVSNPNGIADLSVSIVSVGYLNPQTNIFVPVSSVPDGVRAAVRFKVANSGTKNSGTWSFRAQLPSDSNPVYNSNSQQNLGPGDSIVYTLGFDNPTSGPVNPIVIVVDPSNLIQEISKTNNSTTANIAIMGGNNGQYGNGADLSISNIVATNSGVNYGYYNPNYTNQVTVRFTVKNSGGSPTGQWRFQANLPTQTNSQYVSDYQASLNPGQSVVLSLTYTSTPNPYQYQNNVVSITLDPYNQIQEINKNNNYGSVIVQ